jgi:hypothetical protein
MPPKLHNFIAVYESIIRKLGTITEIYNAIMDARQYVGNHRFLEFELKPAFKNNRGVALNQSAQILTGDWHNLDKSITSAYDEALLQIIKNG